MKKEDDSELVLLKPTAEKLEELKISGNDCYVCFPEHSKVKEIRGFISFNGLINYLNGYKPEPSDLEKIPYIGETRTGIKIEKGTKTAAEGHLYTAEFLRLKDNWKFIVWYEDSDNLVEESIKNSPLIRLGGEGRGAVCKIVDERMNIDVQNLIEEINKAGKFKLYLASPAYFGGFKPNCKILKDFLGVDKLDLIGALPGKPVYIGGYDFANNRAKPLKRWVNTGAVYYYRFTGKIKDDISFPIKIINESMDMRCSFIARWERKCLKNL